MKKIILLSLPILLLVSSCANKTTTSYTDAEQIQIESTDVVKTDENPFKLNQYIERDFTYSVMFYEYPSGKLAGWKSKQTGKFLDINMQVVGVSTPEIKTNKQTHSNENTPSAPEKEYNILIQSSPEKRLLEIDLVDYMKLKSKLKINFFDEPVNTKKWPELFTVKIKELSYREKEGSLNRSTVILPSNKIDFAVAVFAMPKNASVIMDVLQQKNVIEYAYEVEFSKNSVRIKTEVVRGTAESTGESCENFRVRNVFGGEKAMDHYPSKEIRSLCEGASELKDISRLRMEIIYELAHTIGITLKSL